MAPGILRLRTVCCTLVIPIRLAICLPLLICTLNAYSPHAALFPTPQSPPPPLPQPLIINITRPRPALANPPEDTHRAPVYEYIALRPPPASGGGTHTLGRTLTLSFVLAAAALSVLSMVALWLPREQDAGGGDADDATLVEAAEGRAGAARWVRVGALWGAPRRGCCSARLGRRQWCGLALSGARARRRLAAGAGLVRRGGGARVALGVSCAVLRCAASRVLPLVPWLWGSSSAGRRRKRERKGGAPGGLVLERVGVSEEPESKVT
ncbi:hypothetical protein BC826DRAFT_509274 [Russula brevipes]|nr:hypothetical protein BC826DRAFT_509274 [Russula brevipes]